MRPTAFFALHARFAAALAGFAATAASAQETRSHTGGRFHLDIGGEPALVGSAEGGGGQQRIEIESWSWGAAQAEAGAAVLGRGAPIAPVIPLPEVVAPRDVASGQASGKRKGWDGTVKGGNVVESNATAKFGAISGVKRNDSLAEPAAKIAPPKAVSHDLRTNVVARTAPPPLDGSITVDGRFPGCTVGAKYATAVLRLADVGYVMTDVQITSCPAAVSAARSSMAGEYPGQHLSLNYKKVIVRGWDPEKKEE